MTTTTTWLPSKGQLFYVQSNRFNYVPIPDGNTVTFAKRRDGSWGDTIFRLEALDARNMVASLAHGAGSLMLSKSYEMLLERSLYTALPVGPDVAKALGLEITADPPHPDERPVCDTLSPEVALLVRVSINKVALVTGTPLLKGP